MDIGLLLGGAILTETVFGLPGLGLIAIESISNFDLAVTRCAVVFGANAIIVFDPRLRLT
jgi:peptide/nickel transport system permease protein